MRRGQAAILLIVLLVAVVAGFLLVTSMTGRVIWQTSCVKIGQECKAVILNNMDSCRRACVQNLGQPRHAFDSCVEVCAQAMLERCTGKCNPRCLSTDPIVQPFEAGKCNNEML